MIMYCFKISNCYWLLHQIEHALDLPGCSGHDKWERKYSCMTKRIKGKEILNLDTEWRNFCFGTEVEKEIFRNSLRRSTDRWGWGGTLLRRASCPAVLMDFMFLDLISAEFLYLLLMWLHVNNEPFFPVQLSQILIFVRFIYFISNIICACGKIFITFPDERRRISFCVLLL